MSESINKRIFVLGNAQVPICAASAFSDLVKCFTLMAGPVQNKIGKKEERLQSCVNS